MISGWDSVSVPFHDVSEGWFQVHMFSWCSKHRASKTSKKIDFFHFWGVRKQICGTNHYWKTNNVGPFNRDWCISLILDKCTCFKNVFHLQRSIKSLFDWICLRFLLWLVLNLQRITTTCSRSHPPQKWALFQVLNLCAKPWSESHIRNRNRNASAHFLLPLFSVLARPYITICSPRAQRHSAGLSNSAPLRKTFDFICSVSCSGRRWGHLLAAEGVKRHAHPVLGDTKLTMHLSLNNVNVLRIRWQWSWRVRWGRRAVRRASSLALLQQ